jgi:glycerol-3-phosphate acyltransferase PlsY
MDILKGCIAVNLVYLISDYQLLSDYRFYELKLVLGIAAVFGHLFPVYIGFRGGKGIATLLGLMLGVYWQAAVVSILVFIITFLISRYVSLSSIVSTIFFPVIVILLPYQGIITFQDANNSLIIFSVFVPILTLITHQKNIERLIRREENKANFDKK